MAIKVRRQVLKTFPEQLICAFEYSGTRIHGDGVLAGTLLSILMSFSGKRRCVGAHSRYKVSALQILVLSFSKYMPSLLLRPLNRERDDADETQANVEWRHVRQRRPLVQRVPQALYFFTRHSLFAGGLGRVPRLVLRPRRSILPFIHNVDSGPPLSAADVPCPCLLPDVVVELQRSVNELSLAAQALSTKKGTSKEARNSARKWPNMRPSWSPQWSPPARSGQALYTCWPCRISRCSTSEGSQRQMSSRSICLRSTVNESMTMIQTMGRVDRFISGSSTAGQIQTWSLGIAELGAMLKIDKASSRNWCWTRLAA
ncbi:hypothetical protein BKA62DRAFT_107453 [Auriculariales sp. MPI-PUGE-AT-0066]|nr:hypothetical protein BKA62DRAFT_107453 [Auriculariales sp. MPI-PUGE-AT-0066]